MNGHPEQAKRATDDTAIAMPQADPWSAVRPHTPARIGLGCSGGSLPTRAHLDFQLAHALARDAVHHAADLDGLAVRLGQAGLAAVRLASAAPDRGTYLRRPDLGRQLAAESRATLAALALPGGVDLALVIADGLSGHAVERQAPALAELVAGRLRAAGWSLGPVAVVSQGRVAIGDAIGDLLGARLVAVLIGERPGLSAPDSLGAYLTWEPRPGRSDAERNCVSNIRPGGLPIPLAAERLCWLLTEARRRRLSGIGLKEEMDGGLLR